MNSLCNAAVIWTFGSAGGGNSTLVAGLTTCLRGMRWRPCLVLHRDELRWWRHRGLGFIEGDLSENLRGSAEMTLLAVRCRLSVVAATITPLASQRAMIAELLRDVPLHWVWADCPAATCQRRDVKGLYHRQQVGELTGLTGPDGAFEIPGPEALRLDTGSLTVTESVEVLWQQLSLDPPQPAHQITAP